MATYYIDNKSLNPSADGLSPESAVQNYKALPLQPGDTVLFKRGSFYREKLCTAEYIKYGAYGEGEKPIFCPSVDLSSPDYWEKTERENIWRCTHPTGSEVGNFIFNDNECTAALRYSPEEMQAQGEFYDNRYGMNRTDHPQELLLYSVENPGTFYSHIEAACFAYRHCADAAEGVSFDSLHFKNSGVHGIAGRGGSITVTNCVFENIGGCVWSKELKIRYGNGFEIWERGNEFLLENNVFKNIYDSCVTHQGPGEKTEPAVHFICKNNIFDTYGMAAFEYRDKMTVESEFTGNVCKNAGCGFAMLGDTLPRSSEIYPQPMGHHIFLWRIPTATENGSLLIEGNTFGEAPVGAAIYSIISPEAEAQMTLKNNKYTKNDTLLIRFGGKNYVSLEEYKAETEKDEGSVMM